MPIAAVSPTLRSFHLARWLPLACAASLLCQPNLAFAQAASGTLPPGAGDTVRDLPAAPALPSVPPPPEATVPEADVAAPGLRFVLKRFALKGSTALPEAQTQALAAPYIGQSMGDRELTALIASLRRAYADIGLRLVAIGFPTQDVSQGTLAIEVIEPRLARVQAPLGPEAPLSDTRLQGLIAWNGLRSGALLDMRALDQLMFTLNDLPGVQARAALTPSGDEGSYNLAIQLKARRAWDATVGVDNHGSNYAGRWRATALARWNNPLGVGDNLDLQTLLSSGGGVQVGRISYELPVMATPARWSLAYANVSYTLGGRFQALEAHGTAKVWETALSYPLRRTRSQTLLGRVAFENKALVDRIDLDGSRSDKRIRLATAGLSFEGRDAFAGGGFTGASVQLRWGRLGIATPLVREADAAQGELATQGSFGKAEVQLSRLQSIGRRWSWYLALNQQLSSRNLDSAEKMALGGAHGVRAYPTAEGASDEARLYSTELRYWVNPNWTVFGLYDLAQGRRSRDLGTGVIDEGNEAFLRGYGLGLSVSYPQWVTLKATLAWRNGDRPLTESRPGKSRVLVQALHTF